MKKLKQEIAALEAHKASLTEVIRSVIVAPFYPGMPRHDLGALSSAMHSCERSLIKKTREFNRLKNKKILSKRDERIA